MYIRCTLIRGIFNMDKFVSEVKSFDDLKRTYDVLFEDCKSAIQKSEFETILSEYRLFFQKLENTENKINISSDKKLNAAFFLGKIESILSLTKDVSVQTTQNAEFRKISENNKLLDKCVRYLSENDMATSSQIIKDLNLKHRSDLSNMMQRQKKHGLIVTYKIGRFNTYTLTRKGKDYLSESNNTEANNAIYKSVSRVIECLTSQLMKGEINEYEIVLQLLDTNRSLSSYFLQRSFTRRLSELSNSVNYYARKMIIDSLSNIDLNVYQIDETPFQTIGEFELLEENSKYGRVEYAN